MSTANREEAETARAYAAAQTKFAEWVEGSIQTLNEVVSLMPKTEMWDAGAAHVIYRMLEGIREDERMKADLAKSMARIKTREHQEFGKDPDPVSGWFTKPGTAVRRGVELTRVEDEDDLSWQNRREDLAAHREPRPPRDGDEKELTGGVRPTILSARHRRPDPGQPHGA